MFAKLFNTEQHGQILVKIDTDDEYKTEVRFWFEPDNLGVCSMALKYANEDDDKAQTYFDNLNESEAVAIVSNLKMQMGI